jgi:hypothetical protein
MHAVFHAKLSADGVLAVDYPLASLLSAAYA